MIGAGIFALPSAVAERAGVLSPWLFLAAGLMIITVVLALAELASYFRDSGGPVLYATAAFGPLAGFSTGWIYYISRVAAVAANMHVMALYLGAVWPWFDTPPGHAAVVIAVSVVAFGTSVPELATSAVAALKNHSDISVGNVIGSNLCNVLWVIGLVSLIFGLPVDERSLSFDFPIMIGFTVALYPIARTGFHIGRGKGALLLVGYVAYVAALFLVR